MEAARPDRPGSAIQGLKVTEYTQILNRILHGQYLRLRIWVSRRSRFDTGQVSRSNDGPNAVLLGPAVWFWPWSMGCWINKPYSSIFLDLGYWRLGNLNVEISIAGPLAPHNYQSGRLKVASARPARMHDKHQ